jgi:hypothetical protein
LPLDSGSTPNSYAFAGSPKKQAISSALYVGVIPVLYHSLTAAMVMLADCGFMAYPTKAGFGMRRRHNQGSVNRQLRHFAIQLPIEEFRLRFS